MYYILADNKGKLIGVSYDNEGKRVFFKTDDFKKSVQNARLENTTLV